MPYIKITETGKEVLDSLPPSHGMISNYHLLDETIHNKDGFFKLDISDPVVGEDETFSIIPNEYEYLPLKNTYIPKFTVTKKEPEVQPEPEVKPQAQDYIEELHMDNLKERYFRLSLTDWVELPSVAERMDKAERQVWLDYRQALRDCVKVDDPREVVWPVAPYSPLLGSKYPHGYLK